MSFHVDASAPVRELPGEAVPYYLADGDGRAHLLLGQVGRALAGTEETAGAMSVMTALGPAGGPIPMHRHEAEHDWFLCVRGAIQVWADGASRVLYPGDVASVPPGVLHAYQFHGHYSQFMGPIAPAGWDRFFDLTGMPYTGPAYPQVDNSPPPFAKFGAAEAKFAMKYFPEEPYAEAGTGADDALPGAQEPYFLRAGEGPRHLLFGQVAYQLMTGAESGGRLGMTVTEGPKCPPIPTHVHQGTYEGIYCLDGRLRVTIEGVDNLLTRGDFVSIPAGCEHAYALESHLTRFATMYGPSGLERFHEVAGEIAEQRIFPEDSPAVDPDRLAAAGAELDIAFAG
ncbi:MAG TPA: quercetin 2,3-dioxygenase [Solirubrobacteraceae bacterium]|jgi:quercetin dioxygenase-like cupin family protein|nr:quercetin 2,3-dioxygenase [Solirubrobacteraceae bacterium]